jgi:hypothetical protein
VPRTIG